MKLSSQGLEILLYPEHKPDLELKKDTPYLPSCVSYGVSTVSTGTSKSTSRENWPLMYLTKEVNVTQA